MKRVLINCIIIFVVFFLATIIGAVNELLLLINSILITAIIIFSIMRLGVIISSKKECKEIKEAYYYLEKLKEKSYNANFSSKSYEEKKEEISEYDSKIKMLANNLILNIDDYFLCEFYKRFLPKIIYRSNQEKMNKIREKTIKIIKEE